MENSCQQVETRMQKLLMYYLEILKELEQQGTFNTVFNEIMSVTQKLIQNKRKEHKELIKEQLKLILSCMVEQSFETLEGKDLERHDQYKYFSSQNSQNKNSKEKSEYSGHSQNAKAFNYSHLSQSVPGSPKRLLPQEKMWVDQRVTSPDQRIGSRMSNYSQPQQNTHQRSQRSQSNFLIQKATLEPLVLKGLSFPHKIIKAQLTIQIK